MVKKITPLKTVRIKNASSEWFGKEIAEKLSLSDKLFKQFKSSHLNTDWETYKKARNDIQVLIKHNKKSMRFSRWGALDQVLLSGSLNNRWGSLN